TFPIPDLDPFASLTIETDVTVDPKMAQAGTFMLNVDPSRDAACANGTRQVGWKINYDLAKASSAKEDVEAEITDPPVWTATGSSADMIWARILADAPNHV